MINQHLMQLFGQQKMPISFYNHRKAKKKIRHLNNLTVGKSICMILVQESHSFIASAAFLFRAISL